MPHSVFELKKGHNQYLFSEQIYIIFVVNVDFKMNNISMSLHFRYLFELK